MSNAYKQFIAAKRGRLTPDGLAVVPSCLPSGMYEFQKDTVIWALKVGRAAIFADCGLGKTLMQLAWADAVGGNILIVAPLAVADQTTREGSKFGIGVNICSRQSDLRDGINITNYEKLHHFDLRSFRGMVLDESSILKNTDGKTKQMILESTASIKYKLACTATPAPNDFMELGNHAEFLGVCRQVEMLSEYFIHDAGETQKWRLKGHAVRPFWAWVSSWARMFRKPSDIGYDDDGFNLPPLDIRELVVRSGYHQEGYLFPMLASSLQERQYARKNTVKQRCSAIADAVNKDKSAHLIWCNLNSEADQVTKLIDDAVQISGSDTAEIKRQRMIDFSEGKIRVLVTKPSIAGFGMNWQHCHNVWFCGLSDSYEQFYQAIRRCWRFGQKHPVLATVVISDTEGAVKKNIERKEADAANMAAEMTRLYNEGLKNGLAI